MKNIIVTGDTKGLGIEIKNVLGLNGYNVIGISRTSEDIKFDLNNVDNIKELYKEQIKSRGPIHGLINNAAYAYDDLATNLDLEKLKYMYNVNLFSPMMLTKYIIRDMLLNKVNGSIIHISSISVYTGYKGLSMYASTKGALESFSKNISREWGRFEIKSNVVCPGFMNTDMSKSLDEKQKEKILKRNSFQKEIQVSDVANTVLYLLSDKSSGITGQVIKVDNGSI